MFEGLPLKRAVHRPLASVTTGVVAPVQRTTAPIIGSFPWSLRIIKDRCFSSSFGVSISSVLTLMLAPIGLTSPRRSIPARQRLKREHPALLIACGFLIRGIIYPYICVCAHLSLSRDVCMFIMTNVLLATRAFGKEGCAKGFGIFVQALVKMQRYNDCSA